ncbi:MFS general substrate transporter [Pseudohyphozyma bogoriensis]|nr:MFS general substrate transporter [Pseudohyphozyma bogoriensis]
MPTSPTTPSSPMRGSYVLHHIDSCHQHEHDDGDDGGDVTPRHSSERTLGGEQEHEDMPPPIPGDVEKGGMARKQQSRAEDRDRYVPPGERHWPDNIVSWDSPTDRANPMNCVFNIYGVSTEVMTLGTSLFIAGYIPGPIVFAPISEMKCCCAVRPGCRGRPTLSPVIGAAVSQSYLGWRWTEYLVTILTGTVLVLGIIFVPETFGPVLLTKKAQKLRRETGRWELHSRHEMNNFTLDSFIHKNLTLPIRMVVLEPMVLCITLYNATAYGVLLPPMMLGGILFPAGFFSNTFMRSIFAAALPLVAQPLFNNLGYDWACTLLGCLAATLGCVPFLFFVFGEKLRGMSRLTKSPAQRAGKQQ